MCVYVCVCVCVSRARIPRAIECKPTHPTLHSDIPTTQGHREREHGPNGTEGWLPANTVQRALSGAPHFILTQSYEVVSLHSPSFWMGQVRPRKSKYRPTSEILWVAFQTTVIKRGTRMFWFPSAYKSYVYTTLY